jgi:DNA-binding beta-propeller fold protein YncE
MYIVNGGRGAHTPYSFVSIVDTSSLKKLADIKLDTDRVEALALEKSGPRLFVNLTGLNSVGVINTNKHTLMTTWSVANVGQQNVPLVFDEPNHRLFLVVGKPSTFVVLDSDSGKVVASVPCVPMVDDLAFDRARKRIYASGNGFVDVVRQKDPDHYDLVGHVPTSFRAKTAIFVPELNRYYLAVPRHEDQAAEVRIYKVSP